MASLDNDFGCFAIEKERVWWWSWDNCKNGSSNAGKWKIYHWIIRCYILRASNHGSVNIQSSILANQITYTFSITRANISDFWLKAPILVKSHLSKSNWLWISENNLWTTNEVYVKIGIRCTLLASQYIWILPRHG